MFDYFRNYSSNPHQVCCQDSLTEGLYMTIARPVYDHCQTDDLNLHLKVTNASQIWLPFKLQYLGQYLSHYIQTWPDGTLLHGIYAHVDVLELDLDFEKPLPGLFFPLSDSPCTHSPFCWSAHLSVHQGSHRSWNSKVFMYSWKSPGI